MKDFYLGIVLANPFIGSVIRLAPATESAGAASCSLPSGESDLAVTPCPAPAETHDMIIRELLQICPPLKPWQTPLRINPRHQERAVDDAIAGFFDPAPLLLRKTG